MFFFFFFDKDKFQDMAQYESVSEAIRNIVQTMMDKVMERVLFTDPFVEETHHANKPLYAALVPDEIFKGAHFERRFVTPFGSKYILDGGGEPIPTSVTCDILIQSERTGKTYSFELKGPLPNSDQTKVSKEKMFKLLAMDGHPIDEAYYALPYNPYGKRENYDWSFPARWFNMKSDPSVLIGEELWDLIGGEGTYTHFIEEINKLGVHYKERIYREFLGIEPPEDFDKNKLR